MSFSDFSRRPISKESPAGTNPNFLDDFSDIKREINKLSTVTSKVSWKKVFTLSKNILETESKDIRCACYYTVSGTHIDGLKGLVNGLNSLHDLCVIYWYSGFPDVSKTTARMSALDWLTEHAVQKQKLLKISPSDLPLIETGHKLTLKIEEELRTHYGNKAPSLGAIRRIFSQWIEEIQAQRQALEDKENKTTRDCSYNREKSENNNSSVHQKLITTAVTKNKTEEKNSNTKPFLVILSAFIFIICLLFGHFFYNDNQTRVYILKIQQSDIASINEVFLTIENKDTKFKQSIKNELIQRTQDFVKEWEITPLKVNNIDKLSELVQHLKTLYPDSATAKKLETEFTQQLSVFNNEYYLLNQQFKRARTVFANVKDDASNKHIDKAYNYSNSLFPLLGRLEYAEKENSVDELNQTQYLLNVYQHRLNLVKQEIQP